MGIFPFPIFWKALLFRVIKTEDCVLTHHQTTNFRLFQIERVCRRQFEIWRKWQKVIQTGRKQCRKRRNCSLWAISPFPTVFWKGLFPRGVRRCHCVGMGWRVNSLPHNSGYWPWGKKPFWKHFEKRKKVLLTGIFYFSLNVSTTSCTEIAISAMFIKDYPVPGTAHINQLWPDKS